MNRSIVGGLLILAGMGVAVAADEPPPPPPKPTRSPQALEILKEADTKIKAVSSVRYKVKSVPTGIATNFSGTSEGTVVLSGWTGQFPEKFLIEAKGERGGKPMDFTGGGNGESYFLIDHVAKKAYQDIDPAVMGSAANVVFGLAMLEFVHDKPFDDELEADTVELLDPAEVGGVECHQIHVAYAGGRGESVWFFAKSDLLPRRRILKFQRPQGEGAIDRTLQDVEIDPQLPDSTFAFKLPEGYQKIDDFAP